MTLDLLLMVATIGFLGMISPGPDFFFVVKSSLSYPRRYAMMTCLGVVLGIMTHMVYCVAGIAIIIKTTPWLFSLLRYVGALYLIWLGIKAIFSKVHGNIYLGHNAKKHNISYTKALIKGYLCNLLNPKATLFFLAIFTQFLTVDSSLLDKLTVSVIILLEALIWWPFVVFVFQSEAVQRRYFKMQFIIDKLLGLVLIALGIKVALGAI
ncbi:RhtB (resistance to homoserine/threonine) family protein [Orbus hercynius]|uniref:RhtB (Resistance to homoserine/threonine) family protein n=1 Tax=Orbus hercynius TaxID=593135 RepID=A0A495RFB2_9GAMM|nr:LysE family transporter [Orbus hercynius]RKS85960.1 RhtB (resistance to homoserine/threonine) family protein [Orbus hercynius]